jgi:nucleoside-diphosphate-sugar epimerase
LFLDPDFLLGVKIFVTGATGFIGSRLVERLAADNHEVKALVRNPGKYHTGIEKRITVIEGYLENRAALASVNPVSKIRGKRRTVHPGWRKPDIRRAF